MRIFFGFALLLFSVLGLNAQTESIYTPSYKHYTVTDGLCQSQVMSIMQDSRGYIWIGTKGGVSKFNGYRFENFYNQDSVPQRFISQIIEDSSKYIWAFASEGSGYYDGINWKKISRRGYENVSIISGQILGWRLRDSTIYSMGKDSVSMYKKFKAKDFADLQISEYKQDAYCFSMSKNGIIDRYQYSHKFGIAWIHRAKEEELHQSYIKSDSIYFTHFRDQSVPFTTFSNDKNIFFNLPMPPTKPETNYQIHYSNNGTKKVIVISNKVYLLDTQGNYKLLFESPALINQILISSDQCVWIATENGVFQIFPTPFNWISDKLLPQVWSIVEDDKGTYYFSCFGAGLKKLEANQLITMSLPPAIFKNQSLSPYFYFTSSKDKKGNLYFPHTVYAIKLSPYGGFSTLAAFKQANPKLSRLVMTSIYDSTRNSVLFGMQSGIGIYHLDNEAFESVLVDSINTTGQIFSMTQDHSGNYWLGSGWLYKYNPENKNLVTYSRINKKINFRSIWAIKPDSNNGLWLATNIDGLQYKQPGRDSFIRIAPIVINEAVSGLHQLDTLLLIIGIRSFFLLDLKSFYKDGSTIIKAYNKHNGFPGIDGVQGGTLLDSKGNIWILCANGAISSRVSDLDMNTFPSQIRIFQINNQKLSYDSKMKVALAKNENELILRFESIGFQRTLIPEYSWRLLGYSDKWSSWSTDEIAFYSNLPSGNYNFEVKSRHPGKMDEDHLSTDQYSFEVDNNFYREPYFYQYSLYIILTTIGILFILLRALRSKYLSEQKSKLETEERERNMRYYQVQTAQAQLNDHFITNLLSSIHAEINLDRKADAINNLERLAKVMRQFLDSSVSSDFTKIAGSYQDIPLSKEIELLRYYLELEQTLRSGQFDFKIEVQPSLDPNNRYIIPMMIQPFVENAIKHGVVPLSKKRRGLIQIYFSGTAESLICLIKDNGDGYNMEIPPPPRSDGQRSHGGRLVRERAELLKNYGHEIKIETISKRGEGTSVKIIFHHTI